MKKMGLFSKSRKGVVIGTLVHGDVISVVKNGQKRKEIFIFIRIWHSPGKNIVEGQKLEIFRNKTFHVSRSTMIVELQNSTVELIGRAKVKDVVTKMKMYKRSKIASDYTAKDIIEVDAWPYVVEQRNAKGAILRGMVRDGKGFRYSTNGGLWDLNTESMTSFKMLGWVKRKFLYTL
jgi:hypothetical protein